MKIYQHKGIILLGLLVVIVGIVSIVSISSINSLSKNNDNIKSTTSVDKKETKANLSACTNANYNDSSGSVADKYNLDIDDETLEITMSPASSDLREVEFTITKINGRAVTESYVVGYGKSVTLTDSILQKYKDSSNNDVEIVLYASNAIVSGSNGNCLANVTSYLSVSDAYSPPYEVIHNPGEPDEIQPLDDIDTKPEPGADCNNPKSDYEKGFCNFEKNIKDDQERYNLNVINLGNKSSSINSSSKFTGDPLSVQCSKTLFNNRRPDNSADADDDANKEYYLNVAYWTGEKSVVKNTDKKYVYRYAPGNYKYDSSSLRCTVKCKEKVKVLYGPPVATKAGLCFEYQVKAVSYVSCDADKLPKPPEQKRGYCNPRPRCKHKHYTIDRAGPDEEYDQCIKECDGGKYSDVCSQKCYDEVYAYNNQDMLNYYNDMVATKMVSTTIRNQISECLQITKQEKWRFKLNNYPKTEAHGNYGCYYYTTTSRSSIGWWGDDNGTKRDNTPARYYNDEDPNRDYSKYVVKGEGFVRRKHGSDDYCHAKCHHSAKTCASNEYLNPGVAKEDNKKNKKTYKAAVEECKANTKCTSTTATFTIGVPDDQITDSNDELSYDASNGINNNGLSYENKKKQSAYLVGFNGCYKEGATSKPWYRTTWAFQGACLNMKHGSLYNLSNGGNGADINQCKAGTKKFTRKYCLGLNAKNVNVKWWNHYYTKLLNSSSYSSSAFSEGFAEQCGNNGSSGGGLNTSNVCNWKVENLGNDYSPTYNIKAKTKNFGFFKWDVNVNCFYATNSKICNTSESQANTNTGGNDRCKTDYKKMIRTVDLRQLFPDYKDGKITAADRTGRNPGYNWTEYAVNTKKDVNYQNKPSEYTTWVQKKGYSVYTDKYLDYHIKLTTQNIRDIKEATAASDFRYADYKGDISEPIGSVTNYVSTNFLRGTLESQLIVAPNPNSKAFKCNNMRSGYPADADRCEDYSN